MEKQKVKWTTFLWDIFVCSLSSYGGPEAHYGVFSSQLVDKRHYLTKEELMEMIGLYALVPGPSSSQTITAIGYYVGGPLLALLTFFVWAFPAIVIMGLAGIFFSKIQAIDAWKSILLFLPSVAVAFIASASISLSKKVILTRFDFLLFASMLVLSTLFVSYSMWIVPLLLILGGFLYYHHEKLQVKKTKITYRPRWWILILIVAIAISNEALRSVVLDPFFTLYSSFYRYGYSVIGGGQIVIPLMIQDLVSTQSLISLSDFLSGYALDQAIPGPLFSFAAFVSSRALTPSSFAFLGGIIGGLSIFLPGIMLVFFVFPLWKALRELTFMKSFLKGVSITAASLITMTAITQALKLPLHWQVWSVLVVSFLLLISKKIPAPLIVILAMIIGLLV